MKALDAASTLLSALDPRPHAIAVFTGRTSTDRGIEGLLYHCNGLLRELILINRSDHGPFENWMQ